MYLSKLSIVVLPFLGLAAAAPKPSCTAHSSCTAIANVPAPTNKPCGGAGQAHFTAGVIIADVSDPGSTARQCALACLDDEQCQSFAFDGKQQRCLTFRKVPSEMGFRKEAKAEFRFWQRACWKKQCATTTSCSSSGPTSTAT